MRFKKQYNSKFGKYAVLTLSVLGFAVLFSSCEKEIEFKGDIVQPKMVLNGFFNPDMPLTVHLSESRFFLSNNDNEGFKPVENATVKLWKENTEIEILENTTNGIYKATYLPVVGDKLHITASAPGLGAVECSTEIISRPTILSADTIYTYFTVTPIFGNDESYPNYFISGISEITVRMNDSGNRPDYYRLALFFRTHYTDGTHVDFPAQFESNDIVFESIGSTDLFASDNSFQPVFSDELFDGKDYSLKLNCSTYNSINNSITEEESQQRIEKIVLCVELQSLSKAYYLYLKSVFEAESSEDYTGLFSEPVQIFTNIKGGIGILGSYASAVVPVAEIPLP